MSDPAAPARLFDAAEQRFGPVDILVNNATGWLADTFAAAPADRLGSSLQPVTAQTITTDTNGLTAGEVKVPVKLHREVTVPVTVKVVAEGTPQT